MILTMTRGISGNGNTLYQVDATTYGSGVDARVNLGLVALLVYKHSSGDQIVLPASYIAESVTSFSFDVTDKDGVYFGYQWALPLYTGQSLVDGDIVYDAATDKVKKRIAGVLTDITEESLLTETVPNSGTIKHLITTQLTIKRDALLLIELAKQKDLDENCCEYQDYKKAEKNYNYTRSLRSSALIDFCGQNFINAQLKIETGIAFATTALAETV